MQHHSLQRALIARRAKTAVFSVLCLAAIAGHGFGSTGTGTLHTISLPNKTLEVDIAGVAPTASWAVGAIASPGPDAKVALFKTTIQKSRPMSSMDGLAELSVDHAAFSPGSCKVSLSATETNSVGVFVHAPAGTEITITVNGKLYASSLLSSSTMIQDGLLKSGTLSSMGEFLLKMHVAEGAAQSDFFTRNNTLYVSPLFAHGHLASFARPAALATGCCGDRVTVYVELTIDASGSVTNVKSRTQGSANTGALETLLRSWKFEPFVYQGQPSLVHVVAPIIFASDAVMSPLF